MIDFSWTEEQRQLQQKILEFSRQELNSNLIDLDAQEAFNWEGWRKCGSLKIQGLPIPKEYGGMGADILTTIYALEALGLGCKDNGLIFAINAHLWACSLPILTFGNAEQKQKYLPQLCQGELIGGHAISEPEAGSDVYNLKTVAQKRDDKYILNGVKNWVTNGPVSNLYIVFATVDPSKGKSGISGFIVEANLPGCTLKRKISKMGLRTTQLGELVLEDCEVPAENLLGKEGGGMAIFTHSMEWERGFILSSAIGTMERLLTTCVDYAKKRKQFGQSIGKFQLVSTKLVDMKLRLETSRTLLYKVGWLKKMGKSILMEAAMTKLYISESWVQSCLDAIQIYGGYGYLTEFEIERELRDALGSKLYSGTSEIQRHIIAQFMGLGR
ncbi:acyl-CoA dehydrogenase family protein [Crocosphaera sp. UHCC 0190]|uniref:acyl-CoA dehydrogenase family protein n=1 Tax=Crocosphaera sp. UHCC 0190 TaxID=3110246 RepID=UPI002B1F0278|nr:acyl-CoA dehydrogenase family protein [Crocosphaera sp. UHCC 0190]MEA5510558.1 acyl-CoA dehydrogenase family protein [Crocosphaera sp. UHCC 0190]